MTTTRREALRQIMLVAHSWKRQVRCSMGEALRTAWRAAKRKLAAPVKVHRVKPYTRPAVGPLVATAYVVHPDDDPGEFVAWCEVGMS